MKDLHLFQSHMTTPVNVESHVGLSFFLCFLFPITGVPALICSLESRKAVHKKSLPRAVLWSRRACILNGVGGAVVVLLLLTYIVWLISWWLTPFDPPPNYNSGDRESGMSEQGRYRTFIITKSPPLTYPTTESG